MLSVVLLVQALAAAAPSAGAAADQARLNACITEIDQDAEKAYEAAMAWAREAPVREAYVCAALSDIGRGRAAEGAQQLLALAGALSGAPVEERVELLSQAGNAWLLARQPDRAVETFTNALKLAPKEPDLLIDRARAYALENAWKNAEFDLTAALAIRPQDALALRLRAEARLRQSVFDLALKDAEEAAGLEPKSVDTLLALGRAREAKRTGKPPE